MRDPISLDQYSPISLVNSLYEIISKALSCRIRKVLPMVIEQESARISSWKGRFLSLAGRICLVKSVFSSLSLFYFSFFKALKSVYNRIINI